MAKYKVRSSFAVNLNGTIYTEEAELDLTPEQLTKVAHQVEPVAKTSKTKEHSGET